MIPGALAMMFSGEDNGFVYDVASGINTSTLTLPKGGRIGDFVLHVSVHNTNSGAFLNKASGFSDGDVIVGTGLKAIWSFKTLVSAITEITGLSVGADITHLVVVFKVPTSISKKNWFNAYANSSTPDPGGVSVNLALRPYSVLTVVCSKTGNTGVVPPTNFKVAGSYSTAFSSGTTTMAIGYSELIYDTTVASVNPGAFSGFNAAANWVALSFAVSPMF